MSDPVPGQFASPCRISGQVEVLKVCTSMHSQVGKHQDPQDACLAVVVESYKAWLSTEARTDDITVIVVEFELGEGLTCVAKLWAARRP